MSLYDEIRNRVQRKIKSVVLLIDPDKYDPHKLSETLKIANECGVFFILVGGSITLNPISEFIDLVKKNTQIPVFLFPGNLMQLSSNAHGILLLSLISGRNPEFLIENHVNAAPFLKKSSLEIIPTGYILIDTGKTTSVEYVSNTLPIPSDKPEIAVATALAGEMLGLKLIYLEGGSGAQETVNYKVINDVKRNITIPIIVGGGIKSSKQALDIFKSGADIIVVGNAVEQNPEFLYQLAEIALTQ